MSQTLSAQKARQFIEQDLLALGFDDVRFVSADACDDQSDRLSRFIEAGAHGTMAWMQETQARRSHPTRLWNDVKTIIVAAMNYGPDGSYDPMAAIEKPHRGTVSCYAHNRDYHDVMKGKLKQAAGRLAAKTDADVKVFVDTAPVMEKPIAQKAGLGWQGKHTNLVSRQLGSWFFIGSIFTSLELTADSAEIDHCGSCSACLDACPTNAFPAPYQLDARRCISYLTIEHDGPIDHMFRKAMGNRIYGCDDCLAVCPWNKFAAAAKEAKLVARDDLKSPPLEDLLRLDDASFRKMFAGSPIKRIGHARFIRNCLIAAGNGGVPTLVEFAAHHLKSDSDMVRGAAVWAIGELASPEQISSLRDCHLSSEQSEAVRDEWMRTQIQ